MPEDLEPGQVVGWFVERLRQAKRADAALRTIAAGKEVDRGGHTEAVDREDDAEVAGAALKPAPCRHEDAALAVLKTIGCLHPCPADVQCQCRESIAGVLAETRE
jgi:hypothetical protein